MGRTDDVINVAGHRLSTGSMEAVLAGHPAVAECAVIGVHDELKGQVPRGLVVLKAGVDVDPDALRAELVQRVRDEIGAVASFRQVDVVAGAAEDAVRARSCAARCAPSPTASTSRCRRPSRTRPSWTRCGPCCRPDGSGRRCSCQWPSWSRVWWPSQGMAPLATVVGPSAADRDQVMAVGPADRPVAVGDGAAVAVAGDDGAALGVGEEPAGGAGFDDLSVGAEGDDGVLGVAAGSAGGGPGDPADPGQGAAGRPAPATGIGLVGGLVAGGLVVVLVVVGTRAAGARVAAVAAVVVVGGVGGVVEGDQQVGVAAAAAAGGVGVGQVGAADVGQGVQPASGRRCGGRR